MHNRHSRHSHHDTILAGLTALLLLTFGPIQADEVESDEADPDYELFEIFLSGNAEERLLIAEDCEDLADEIERLLERRQQETILKAQMKLDL